MGLIWLDPLQAAEGGFRAVGYPPPGPAYPVPGDRPPSRGGDGSCFSPFRAHLTLANETGGQEAGDKVGAFRPGFAEDVLRGIFERSRGKEKEDVKHEML